MDLPDFRGYELENHIYSAASRVVLMWFSRIDREAKLWRQIQLTLVNAGLKMATFENMQGFPPLKRCEVSPSPGKVDNWVFTVFFDAGSISFDCEDITWSQLARKVRFAREDRR